MHKFPIKPKEIKPPIKSQQSLNDALLSLIQETNTTCFLQRFKDVIKTYTTPQLSIDPCNDIIFTNNVNDDRIKKFQMLNHLFNNLKGYFLPENFFNTISIDKDSQYYNEIASFWLTTTNKVIKKQILGFPLCIYSNKTITQRLTDKKIYNFFFLKHDPKITNSTYIAQLTNDETLFSEIFQKVLIFFYLQKYKMTSQNFLFEEIKTKPFNITFKISNLVFIIPIKSIIILSPLTHLVSQQVTCEDYINHLEQTELDFLEAPKSTENFYFFLYSNFQRFLHKQLYNIRNVPAFVQTSKETTNLIPGYLYIMKLTNIPVLCLILSKNEYYTNILSLIDSSPNSLSSSKRTFNNDELKKIIFYDPEFTFGEVKNSSNYFIGE